MHTQLKQELYKLNHRKLPWVIIILMLFLMIVMGLTMGRTYSNLLVMTCYNSSAIIMLILVIVGSTMFSMEFQHGTIIPLIYRSSSRSAVFFAKFITLFLYDLILHIAAMILTVLLNIVPIINAPVSWTAIYQYHQPLVVNMFMTAGVDMVTSTLIISLICLTSCLINSNTAHKIDLSVEIRLPFSSDYGRNIHFGKNVFINSGVMMVDLGGISISDNVLIGPKVTIASVNHPLQPAERRHLELKPVNIHRNAWIGANSVIVPEITIGENAVVAAGSVVTHNVSQNAVVAGSLARVIKLLK